MTGDFEVFAVSGEYERRRVLIREEVIRIGSRLSAALDAIDRYVIAEAADRLREVESSISIREVVDHLRDLGDAT